MQNQKLDDSVLVSNYIEGNERCLEILILRHKQRIFSFIYSKVQDRDVADDIFQDTFIKVINTLKLVLVIYPFKCSKTKILFDK